MVSARRSEPETSLLGFGLPIVSRAVVGKWTHAVGEQFLSAVQPIYTIKASEIPDQDGSCVLVQVGGLRYALTAEHIVDQLPSRRLYIGGQNAFVEITGECLATPKPDGDRNKDHYDFAIWPVPPDAALRLGGVSFIRSRQIAIREI
jgi:hypothetical protein